MDLLKKALPFLLVLFANWAIGQEIGRLENGTYFAAVHDEISILNLKKIDSVSQLVLLVSKSKYRQIDLISPNLLTHLSIHDPKLYTFTDSFPNLNSIGIEANFKGKFPVKFDQSKVKSLSVYNFKKDNFLFLKKFSSLDSVYIGFKNNYDAVLSSLKDAGDLKLIQLWANKSGGVLSNKINTFKKMTSFQANIAFSDTNLEILKACASIKEIEFCDQTIKKVPENLKNFPQEIRIVFHFCRIAPLIRDQIRKTHENVIFR